MARPIEIEIKLAATPAMLEALRSHPILTGAELTDTLVTTYYDALGARLRRGGAALRMRDSGKGREQTLKLASPGAASVRRREWNVAAAGEQPDLSGFPVRAQATLARLLDGASLETVAINRIERTTRRLHSGGSAIEIALDVGKIEAGGREAAICELEIELIEGRLADAIAVALDLPLGPELWWSISSKAERSHLLAYDLPPAAIHACPVKLSPGMDAAKGFQVIAWNCLGQLLGNYPLAVASGYPEAIHQCRVAIRRLRAACSVFRNIVDDDEAPVLRAELKAVAMGLGPARDLHVLLGHAALAARAGDRDADELLAHLGVRRDAATHSAQVLLASGAFQRLLFQFAGWIEGGNWLKQKGETGGDQPLVPFASRALARRRRKMRRLNDPLSDLSDAARHQLRIEAKKLRYASEFFASLYPGRKPASQRRAFVKALGRLQDSLGELNDMIIVNAARKAVFEGLEPIAAARLAAQLEELLAVPGKSRGKLLKAADRSLARVIKAATWWSG